MLKSPNLWKPVELLAWKEGISTFPSVFQHSLKQEQDQKNLCHCTSVPEPDENLASRIRKLQFTFGTPSQRVWTARLYPLYTLGKSFQDSHADSPVYVCWNQRSNINVIFLWIVFQWQTNSKKAALGKLDCWQSRKYSSVSLFTEIIQLASLEQNISLLAPKMGTAPSNPENFRDLLHLLSPDNLRSALQGLMYPTVGKTHRYSILRGVDIISPPFLIP